MFKATSLVSSRISSVRTVRPGSKQSVRAAEIAEVAGLADAIRGSLSPAAEFFASQNLPAPLVKYGHPGNMAVVLLAMGGYGSYLGWQIRKGEGDVEKAVDLHPKLMGGAFFFFALGASGGLMSLIMQGKPILESGHATSAFIGLSLLAVQAMLPLFFQESEGAKTAHAYLGTATMAVLFLHAAQGVGLALAL